MEIIPILSTIILVATIATFILAIAAYVLYKVRERRGRANNRVEVVTAAPVAQQPALAAQPYMPNALPPMAMSGAGAPGNPMLALPPPLPLYGAYNPQGHGNAGPIAVDTDGNGTYDTVYEARPTYQNPVTGAPAAYQPAADAPPARPMLPAPTTMPGMATGIPGVPGVQGLPGMSAAPPVRPLTPLPAPVGVPITPPAGRGSMFFEVTNQGLVPTPGGLAAAEDQERARLGAIRREQDRLDVAEDASRDRLDNLHRQQDAPAWL